MSLVDEKLSSRMLGLFFVSKLVGGSYIFLITEICLKILQAYSIDEVSFI